VHHDEAVERFYTTKAWRKARQAKLADTGGLCELCMKKGLIVPAVHVHHKVHLTGENVNDPSVSLDSSNLMALCSDCHSEIHAKTKNRRYKVDKAGRVLIYGEQNLESV